MTADDVERSLPTGQGELHRAVLAIYQPRGLKTPECGGDRRCRDTHHFRQLTGSHRSSLGELVDRFQVLLESGTRHGEPPPEVMRIVRLVYGSTTYSSILTA